MKSFEYGDDEIGTIEVGFGVCNMIIGFGVLTLPRTLAGMTRSSDGWMSIVLGGAIALGVGGVVAMLMTRFPKKGFREMTAAVANKGIANAATLIFALYTFMFVAYETRGLANISKLYLFDRTPEEVICLFFLLVVVYGVAGPSVSLLRLNLLFLPAVLLILLVVLVMNIAFFNIHNLKPLFVTDWKEVALASKGTVFSFLGFEIFLFYNAWVNQPGKAKKAMVSGLAIPLVTYLLVFFYVLGIFGPAVTQNTLYPTAELAKQVEIPGGFFERFESIFFTIWVMSLFNTAVMAYDVTLIALQAVFAKGRRMRWILILTPLVYLIAMQPRSVTEIDTFGEWISYAGLAVGWGFPVVLLLAAVMRRVKGDGKSA